MAKRSTLWVPFDIGSNNTVANTQNRVSISSIYNTAADQNFKGTVLAIKGMVALRQDAPSNALERFAFSARVVGPGVGATAVDLFTALSKDDFWRLDGYIGGPGGDSTALTDVMAGFTFPIDGRSKRLVGFNDTIHFMWKTSGVMKIAASGRLLLLEA